MCTIQRIAARSFDLKHRRRRIAGQREECRHGGTVSPPCELLDKFGTSRFVHEPDQSRNPDRHLCGRGMEGDDGNHRDHAQGIDTGHIIAGRRIRRTLALAAGMARLPSEETLALLADSALGLPGRLRARMCHAIQAGSRSESDRKAISTRFERQPSPQTEPMAGEHALRARSPDYTAVLHESKFPPATEPLCARASENSHGRVDKNRSSAGPIGSVSRGDNTDEPVAATRPAIADATAFDARHQTQKRCSHVIGDSLLIIEPRARCRFPVQLIHPEPMAPGPTPGPVTRIRQSRRSHRPGPP